MAAHIEGPLYYERMGRSGPVMVFIHPNPMDQSCWIYQMAHFSTWFRCIAIDIPGYGRSPKATDGLTVDDMAQACWEAVDEAFGPGESAILIGCSVGAALLPALHHQRADKTRAIVISGFGYTPGKEFADRNIQNFREKGIAHRWDYSFHDMSPAYRTTHLAHWFTELFNERNDTADVETIIRQFEALKAPDAPGYYERIACPAIILTGSEDAAHPRAAPLQKMITGCELRTLPGAGHACQLEQPWLFDRFLIEFLKKHRLFPV